MSTAKSRLVIRTVRVDMRRPPGPREPTYDGTTGLLKWVEPLDTKGFTHYRIRVGLDNSEPAVTTPVNHSSIQLSVADDDRIWISSYSQISGLESPLVMTRKISGTGLPGSLTFDVAVENYGWITAENIAFATAGSNLRGINFFVVFVDELTADCFATTNASVTNLTDPVVLTVTPNPAQVSTLAFAVGDWIVWNDAGKFEIGLLVAKAGNVWTIQRHYPGEGAGLSTFEAPMVAHASGIQLFKGQVRQFLFSVNADSYAAAGIVNRLDMPLPAACVVAVLGAAFNTDTGYGIWATDNCASATVPGLRTCCGGEFAFQADTVTAAAGVPVAVNNYRAELTQPQRTNICYVPVAVTGADLVVNVMVTDDEGATWAVLEQLTVAIGNTDSWVVGDTEHRQTPYSGAWPFRVLKSGDQLNFSIEAGASDGLTIKVNT